MTCGVLVVQQEPKLPASLCQPSGNIVPYLCAQKSLTAQRQNKMNITDLWPVLSIVVPIVVLYFGYIQQLRIRVAVLEKTVENQQLVIENQQKRMDNHSKKQDEMLNLLSDMKLEMVKQNSHLSNELGIVATEVKNLVSALHVSDTSISIHPNK